jgi:hypothetical protein
MSGWVERSAGWHPVYSASAWGTPTFVAPIEYELDSGYDTEADGAVELLSGGLGLVIAAATVADIVAFHMKRSRSRGGT